MYDVLLLRVLGAADQAREDISESGIAMIDSQQYISRRTVEPSNSDHDGQSV